MKKTAKDIPIFALDFEGSKKIGIVEYGVVEILNGEILRCHTRICAPLGKISQKDSDFFGISNECANLQKPFIDDIEIFRSFRNAGVFASHNSSVEDSMLRAHTPSPGIVQNIWENEKKSASWGPWIDTLRLSKKLYPSIENAKLSELINALRLEKELLCLAKTHCPQKRRNWHCALFDALACALIIAHLYKIPEFENLDILWLLQHSGNKNFGQPALF